MHDCLTEQPARTGCKFENAGGLSVWQPRACARAHAGGFSHPAALNPDIKSFPTRGPSESEIQVLQKSSDMHASKMGAWPCASR